MKKILAVMSFIAINQTGAAMAGVNVDIHLGVPAPVVVQPAPVYGPPPPPAYGLAPVVVYDSQPRFIFSPALGFYVSVGVPYDIVYMGPNYYLYSGGYWYVGPSYSGPWARPRHLPPGLRRHSHEQIRYYRDHEYHAYRRDPGHYRGRFHEPEWRRGEGHGGDHERGEHHRGEHRR